ncbi:MAG: pyridoxamine 5'-phosphate oxidase [Flavobacteriia bacterium]|nr:pyridoxamine 5'-phosphate oxidase [Flavobacteriia bacterium]
MHPSIHFAQYQEAVSRSSGREMAAQCCLSSIGLDGYPNARFVALKEIKDESFIITGSLASRKGREVKINPRVALTFWWSSIGVQVRIQGNAEPISVEQAKRYFQKRSRLAQLSALASEQGEYFTNGLDLHKEVDRIDEEFRAKDLPLPKKWGGFAIHPVRMEFLEFQDSRLHDRTLYQMQDGNWTSVKLQP